MDMNQLVEQMNNLTTLIRQGHEDNVKRSDALWTEKEAKMNEKLGEIEQKYEAALSQMRTPTQPLVAVPDGVKAESPEAKAAFFRFARKGDDRLTDMERKALSSDSNTDGGYLVPPTLANQILLKLIQDSPVRSVASVATITSTSYDIPAEDATDFSAGWVSERGSRTQTNSGQIRMEKIPVHEMYAAPHATQVMLDDNAFDVEGWMQQRIVRRYAVVEGLAFISGSGVGQPEGLLTKSGVAETVSGNAGAITSADALIRLYHDLPEFYAKNATWLMRRATLGTIRTLKDTAGYYIFQPALSVGQVSTIMERPYLECPDMPLVATNAYPVIFGDIRAAYQIVDNPHIVMLRDPFTNKPFIQFYTTKRTGGQVVLAEAMRKLKVSA